MGDARLKKIYDDMSEIYDSHRTGSYFGEIVGFLRRIIPSGSKVLEIGSGTGGYCIALQKHGCTAKGVDYSEKMIKVAAENNKKAGTKCTFKVADVEKEIPFSEKFDYIISIDSWEFFPNPREVLRNVRKALNPGGSFIIITPNMFFAIPITIAERLKIKKLSPAYTYYNSFKYKVRRWAEKEGFKLERNSFLFHYMAVSFLLRRKM